MSMSSVSFELAKILNQDLTPQQKVDGTQRYNRTNNGLD
jgi:hypothetical protein